MSDKQFIISRMSPRELSDFRRLGGRLGRRQRATADAWEQESAEEVIDTGVIRAQIEQLIAAMHNEREAITVRSSYTRRGLTCSITLATAKLQQLKNHLREVEAPAEAA